MSLEATQKRPEQQVGRYAIFDEIAAGGMATVHLARLVGSGGFSRVVAAKRMHRHFLQDPKLKRMFLAEARLAARIVHPNVVPILDVLSHDDELIIVMEYIHGESLLVLLRKSYRGKQVIPRPIGCAIVAGLLEGLHAAHEAQNEKGEPLGIVHRDVSPQNVIVGVDGVARVLDFGIAKALQDQSQTNPGTLKGKYSYMAPEVIRDALVTRQADVFSAGVVLWEVLAGKMLFGGTNEHDRLTRIIAGNYPSPRQHNPTVPPALEKIVAKALEPEPSSRYATALEFALAIESAGPVATRRVVSEWVRRLVPDTLDQRESMIHAIETSSIGWQSELPLSSSSLDGTPIPIGNEESNPPIEVGAEASSDMANRDTGSYACLEVDRPEHTALAARRRPLVGIIAVAAAVGIVVIAVVLLLKADSPKPVPATVSDPGASQATGTRPAPAVFPPVAQPDPPIEEPTAATDDLSPPEPSEKPTMIKGKKRHTSVPPRAKGHAKQYLPSNL